MNQSTYEITIEQLIKAIEAGAEPIVIINGEYYDIKKEER